MPTWSKPSPPPQPLKCETYWHIWHSGLMLATYNLIGRVTNGGQREFYVSIEHVSDFLESNYDVQRRVFRNLVSFGWLEILPGGHYKFVSHDEWVKSHPGGCAKRELMVWQYDDTDPSKPLVGKLHAITGGKLRARAGLIQSLRTFASDDVIEATFQREWQAALGRRRRGDWQGTSPPSVLFLVHKLLKEQKTQAVETEEKW